MFRELSNNKDMSPLNRYLALFSFVPLGMRRPTIITPELGHLKALLILMKAAVQLLFHRINVRKNFTILNGKYLRCGSIQKISSKSNLNFHIKLSTENSYL